MIKIGVLIATSMNRIDLLINRSLNSVLSQTRKPDCIVIVDDNKIDCFEDNKKAIDKLENTNIFYLPNIRTKNMSGTGAWNTGIDFLKNKLGEDAFVAILDDDDSWKINYLEECNDSIVSSPDYINAVFAYLKRTDCKLASVFSIENLVYNNFLIGNPGIQGSNMFFRIKALANIEGFDETLHSCTDRDLMIRFLQQTDTKTIKIIPKVLVSHFAGENTVTSDFEKKRYGLDSFYKKFLNLYTLETLKASLERSEKLFKYSNSQNIISNFKNEQTILLTGVCGLIGSHTAKALIKKGYSVIGIDNLSTGVISNISSIINSTKFKFYQVSILDSYALNIIFDNHNISSVIHLAALPRVNYSYDFPKESYEVNVLGTERITSIAIKNNVKQIIFSSSSSVYGTQKGGKISEDYVTHPMSPYAEQKVIAEQKIESLCKNEKTKVLILRLFNVYGFSNQPVTKYSTIIPKFIKQLKNNEELIIYNNGKQSRDFTYINDVVKAFIKGIENYSPTNNVEVINIGYGNDIDILKVVQKLEKAISKNATFKKAALVNGEPFYTLANNKKAEDLLDWKPDTDLDTGIQLLLQESMENETIVIGVAMHNSAKDIRRCLASIIKQVNTKRNIQIVIGNDNSTDNWKQEIEDILNSNIDKIHIINLNHNSAIKTRNAINDYIIKELPNAVLIGRLDSDDEYSDEFVLSKIENIWEKDKSDLILAGNYLRHNGSIQERVNKSTIKLLNPDYLSKRLEQMSEGISTAELPSCNLFIAPKILNNYPNIKSAEDHALLVNYLKYAHKYKWSFAEDLLAVIYSLDGNITQQNKYNLDYILCRKQIFTQFQKVQ